MAQKTKLKQTEIKKMKNEKINRLKEVLSLFWNSYQHMYDVRERNGRSMIDFLLIVSTFLPILSITLYTTKLFNNPIILLPIIPQIASIIILLKSFVIGSSVHWFKLDQNFLESLKNEKFEIDFISTIKKLENFTHISMREMGKLIKHSRHLILFSLFSLFLAVFFVLFESSVYLYFLCLILILLFVYIILIYYKKAPDFSKEDEFEKHVKLLENWISDSN